MMSSAIRVFFSSDVNVSFCRRSFSNSTCSAVFFARFTGVVDSTGPPVKAPASRARAHSMIWEEYKPSRRRIAPFCPFGAFSYSATMASLYSGVNARRVGRGAGSDSPTGRARLPPAGRRGCSSDGVDTRTGSPVLPS